MADKMWDILRFLKSPEDEKSQETPLPQNSQAEKSKLDAALTLALSKVEDEVDDILEQEKNDGAPIPVEPSSRPVSDEELNFLLPPEEEPTPQAEPLEAASTGETLIEIPISLITPNPLQPRKLMGEEEIIELADSIKELGILQPVLVRRVEGGYELIAGERRFKAAQRAGLKTIPAMVRETDQVQRQVIALVENIQRKNLSAIEEARCLQEILAETGWSQTELAKRLGRSQAAVANKIRLLKLDGSVQDLIISGKLGERQARSLLSLSLDEQNALAQKAIAEDLSARALETLSETWQSKSGAGRRSQKKEKNASDAPAGEFLHDLAALINKHKERGTPAAWKVKQMDQNSLIVEIHIDHNRNKGQYNREDPEASH